LNKKIKRLFEPNMRLYFILLVVFAGVTFLTGKQNAVIAYAEAALIVALYFYSRASLRRRNRELTKYIESVTQNVDSAARGTFSNFPLPMVVFALEGDRVITANDEFLKITGEREHTFEFSVSDAVPGFSSKWLMEGKNECPDLITVGDRRYRVYGNVVRAETQPGVRGYLAAIYWMDVTEYASISDEFIDSRPVFALIMIDSYEEFFKGLSDKEKSSALAELDDRISAWASSCSGYLSKFDRDRYIFIFEERHLQDFIDGKFSLLDSARTITGPTGLHLTLSIGIGKDGKSFAENYEFASLATDMALSRGGDQAVIKNRLNFEFYGGKSSQIEKHNKVKSRVMANSLSALIHDATRVYIMGHKYADLDSVGAAVGICCAARKHGKTARIVIDPDSNSSGRLIERMKTLPEDAETFIPPQDAMIELDGGSLLVIVDTNRPEQVESEELLLSANRVALIDHHRRAATYIQNAALSFHEPYASSACELVTELLQYIADPADILRYEAEALLSGIVLDTKNFTLRTGGRTFEAAAFLRHAGADTTEVKRLLQTDLPTVVERYSIIRDARIYRSGIAIASPTHVRDRVIAAQAADELLNISGITASFVIFPDNGSVAISARSLGDTNVQFIVEKLGGGGNKSTAGAQITGKTMSEVEEDLIAAIDGYLRENGR